MLSSTRFAPFLARDLGTDKLYMHWMPYNGSIPTVVMKKACKQIMKLDLTNSFYPLDALDFFSLLFSALEKIDWQLPTDIKNRQKYIARCLHNEMYDVIKDHITPLRKEYSKRMYFTRQDSETDEEVSIPVDEVIADDDSLYPDDTPHAARQNAREILAAVFPRLKPSTRKAFEAWIQANGVMMHAAKLMGESNSTYKFRFPPRCREFKRVYFTLFHKKPF